MEVGAALRKAVAVELRLFGAEIKWEQLGHAPTGDEGSLEKFRILHLAVGQNQWYQFLGEVRHSLWSILVGVGMFIGHFWGYTQSVLPPRRSRTDNPISSGCGCGMISHHISRGTFPILSRHPSF